MGKDSVKIAAVVDIGSSRVAMRISQADKFGRLRMVDELEYPTDIGHEVFTGGKISFESLRALSDILAGYQTVLREYGVSRCVVYATTAMREALNRAYVLDALRIGNGLEVSVLEEGEEAELMVAQSLRALPEGAASNAPTLMAYIGTGSIGITQVEDGLVAYSQNIRMGWQRLGEMIDDIQEISPRFYLAVDEYLETLFSRPAIRLPYGRVSTLILSGSEAALIARLCGALPENSWFRSSRQKLQELYSAVRPLTAQQIEARYQLRPEQARMLYASVSICERLAELTGAEQLLYPDFDVTDSFLREQLVPHYRGQMDALRQDCTYTALIRLAERFQCDLPHAQRIAAYADQMFGRLRRHHGLAPRRRVLLEAAALLLDSGYTVNARGHHVCSSDLVKNMHIFGLREQDVRLVAAILRQITDYQDEESADPLLREKERLLVARLAAILRIAAALDRSRRGKLQSLEVRVSGDAMSLQCVSDEDMALELWAVQRAADNFEEVFGLQPGVSVQGTTASGLE